MAAKDGIEHMVATPHANDRYYYDRAYLLSLREQLQLRVGPTPRLSLGCDFHLSYENTQAAMQTPEPWCIANTRYLLVEFNNFSIPQPLDDWLASMCEREITPIITHPERNPICRSHRSVSRIGSVSDVQCKLRHRHSPVHGAKHAGKWRAIF